MTILFFVLCFFFFFFFYPCSIYYYSCEVLRLNLSHLAEHEPFFFFLFSWLESGFKPILDPSIPLKSPFSFYRIVTPLFHLRGRLSFISFICSLVACLFFFFSGLRGCLMWVYPTVQAVNVDLSMQSVIYPSTQKPSLHPSYLSTHLQLTFLAVL